MCALLFFTQAASGDRSSGMYGASGQEGFLRGGGG